MIIPLRAANPPIIKKDTLDLFINDVFGNLDQILALHKKLLGALFERQREQHPIIHSVADIILNSKS